ncbi:hypothetical protein K1T71_005479 [Dendrolimus kikuchii]|uniref:Uncharacterized protein n=1 Tax=Dendrolimus kikuchii TaxID=765133 RepID=A0ACC1D4Q3_9NEOP|nr:hypothetical protein K1T71_005479 [Dendrolimus kikuchii]
MRATIVAFRRNIINVIQARKYASPAHRCDAHMNELPVPCGPWGPWYKEKQSLYTKILVFGTLWWLFSFGMMIYTGSIDLNFFPPAQPGPPSDMVEECDDTDN